MSKKNKESKTSSVPEFFYCKKCGVSIKENLNTLCFICGYWVEMDGIDASFIGLSDDVYSKIEEARKEVESAGIVLERNK